MPKIWSVLRQLTKVEYVHVWKEHIKKIFRYLFRRVGEGWHKGRGERGKSWTSIEKIHIIYLNSYSLIKPSLVEDNPRSQLLLGTLSRWIWSGRKRIKGAAQRDKKKMLSIQEGYFYFQKLMSVQKRYKRQLVSCRISINRIRIFGKNPRLV